VHVVALKTRVDDLEVRALHREHRGPDRLECGDAAKRLDPIDNAQRDVDGTARGERLTLAVWFAAATVDLRSAGAGTRSAP
jgi:hypothetical protein